MGPVRNAVKEMRLVHLSCALSVFIALEGCQTPSKTEAPKQRSFDGVAWRASASHTLNDNSRYAMSRALKTELKLGTSVLQTLKMLGSPEDLYSGKSEAHKVISDADGMLLVYHLYVSSYGETEALLLEYDKEGKLKSMRTKVISE